MWGPNEGKEGKRRMTYTMPAMKTTASLTRAKRSIFISFQIARCVTKRMAMSPMRLTVAVAMATLPISMHLPGSHGFQALSRGLQLKNMRKTMMM